MKISVQPFDVPMRSPYRSAQRVTTVARNVLVTVTLDSGAVGLGESAPAAYVTGETQESVLGEVQRVAAQVEKLSPEVALQWLNDEKMTPGARGALETAICDAAARELGIPLYAFLGAAENPVRAWATDLSLPILPADDAAARAAQAAADGFRSLKIKVGSAAGRAEDLARVRAVADAAPKATLRLDGNQGFDANDASAFIAALSDLLPRIELFEQPTKADDEMAMALVQSRIPIPVYADESVHHAEDARRLMESGVCRGVVLKLAKSGLAETRRIAEAAHKAGGGCLFGCMMETHIGIGAALHLAAVLGTDIVGKLDLDGHLLVNDENLLTGGFTQNRDVLYVSADDLGLAVTLRTP